MVVGKVHGGLFKNVTLLCYPTQLGFEFSDRCLVIWPVGLLGNWFPIPFHSGVQAVGGSPEPFGGISYGIAAICDLLDRFDLEFFCISLAGHQHLQ